MASLVECLLQATGPTSFLNDFDHTFRSGAGPQWPDRPGSGNPRYSLHAFVPVPEDIRCRGYGAAGRLWCLDCWDTPDDLQQVQVKRVLGKRRYRFFIQEKPPKQAFAKIAYMYPELCFTLTSLSVTDGKLASHIFQDGHYRGLMAPRGAELFLKTRNEMGFES